MKTTEIFEHTLSHIKITSKKDYITFNSINFEDVSTLHEGIPLQSEV